MAYLRLTNLNWTNSADYLPFRQLPDAYDQSLAVLIASILVELNVDLSKEQRNFPVLVRTAANQRFSLFLFITFAEDYNCCGHIDNLVNKSCCTENSSVYFTVGLVQTFPAKADFGPVTLGLGNNVLSGRVAASPAAMNELGSDGLLSVTETFADPASTDIPQPIKSEKVGKRIAELQPPTEARIGMQILGGLALLLWVQRLRSYGN